MEEKHCTNCEEIVKENDKFCANCGNDLSTNDFVPEEEKNVINGVKVITSEEEITEDLKEDNKEDKDKANTLTFMSLACAFIFAPLARFIVSVISDDNIFHRLIASVPGLLYAVSFGLIIYVRFKYPKHTFSKVVLIIYIVLTIIGIIAFIVLFYVFMESLRLILEAFSGCPG